MKKGFWKKQFEEHKFYLGYIVGLLTWMFIIFLAIVVALITQVLSGT